MPGNIDTVEVTVYDHLPDKGLNAAEETELILSVIWFAIIDKPHQLTKAGSSKGRALQGLSSSLN